MSLETLKKKVTQSKQGRKRKGEEASQYCIICHRPFAVTYGYFEGAKKGFISTKNIFQVPYKKGLTKPLAGFLKTSASIWNPERTFLPMFVCFVVGRLGLQ